MKKLPINKLILFLTLGCMVGVTNLHAGKKPAGKSKQPDAGAEQKYQTKVLWDFDGLMDLGLNGRSTNPKAYNGNAYFVVILPELKTRVVKVPLNGGEVQISPLGTEQEYLASAKDNHRFFQVGIDSLGYIHVSGNMHSTPVVNHWVSKKPEDISEFVFAPGDSRNGPQGFRATYPHFYRSPEGVLYHMIRSSGPPEWGLCLSVLDPKTQTWSALAADIPKTEGGKPGHPFTVWESSGEGGTHGYMQPHHSIFWGKDKRMHMAFSVLNYNTPTASTNRHTLSDVLYAYSDDGGKTFHRGDGTVIQLPMRAKAGPHQGDVVYSEHEGPPPWLELGVAVRTDEKNRPIVSFASFKTGPHSLVLDNGKWTEIKGPNPPANAPNLKVDADQEKENERPPADQRDSRLSLAEMAKQLQKRSLPAIQKSNLPYEIGHLDQEYLRDTGNFLYTVGGLGNKRVKLVLSKPLPAKENDR